MTTTDAAKPANPTPVAAALPAPAAVQATVNAVQGDRRQRRRAGNARRRPSAATLVAAAASATPAAKAAAGRRCRQDRRKGQSRPASPASRRQHSGGDTKAAAKTATPTQADGKPADTDANPATAPAHASTDRVTLDAQPAAGTAPQAAAAKPGTDAVQPLAINTPAPQTSAPTAASALAPQAQQFTSQAVPLAGVAFEIAGKALAGKNHFDIRLDPPELGRIEVRLDVSRDGSISSHVIADRKDTLDLLQRDASGLQRAFAGRRPENLRQRHAILVARSDRPASSRMRPIAAATPLVVEDETPIEALPINYGRSPASGGGLDIRV